MAQGVDPTSDRPVFQQNDDVLRAEIVADNPDLIPAGFVTPATLSTRV